MALESVKDLSNPLHFCSAHWLLLKGGQNGSRSRERLPDSLLLPPCSHNHELQTFFQKVFRVSPRSRCAFEMWIGRCCPCKIVILRESAIWHAFYNFFQSLSSLLNVRFQSAWWFLKQISDVTVLFTNRINFGESWFALLHGTGYPPSSHCGKLLVFLMWSLDLF